MIWVPLITFFLFSASIVAEQDQLPLVLADAADRVPSLSSSQIIAQPSQKKEHIPQEIGIPQPKPANKHEKITFSFNEEELENVINFVGTKMGYNLLFPTKPEEKIKGKLTWHLDKKVTIEEAWNLLQTIVTIAGYSIIPHPTYHEVTKTNQNITKEALPLYIGVPFEKLPPTDAHVRFIHYLANIKSTGEGESEISQLLRSWLPQNSNFLIDNATNALIITAGSNDIRGVMPIIASLDRPGFQEKMEIIPLRYTESKMVSDLFNQKILGTSDFNRYRLDTKKPSEMSYFSKYIKIMANERQNNLIVLGRAQAIDRVRNFIKNYIDVPPDSGKSVLHVYQLQYLDVQAFAQVLQNVLQQKEAGGFDQSTGGRQTTTGPQRYFDEVIIATDAPTDGVSGEEGEGSKYGGGNKLIVACRNDDWKRIEQLIGKLDQPTPQVLIEVLIADLTMDDTKALGTALRNPEKIPMPGNTAFQSAQLSPGVMPDTFTPANAKTIGLIEGIDGTVQAASDMLRAFNINPDTGAREDGMETNIAAQMTPGSSVISFNDSSGKTWGITQLLKLIDHNKILSHPHVIARSDKKALIESSETRKVTGQTGGSTSAAVVKTEDIKASLEVAITPRIAINEIGDSSANLQVVIKIDQFTSTSNNNRITREVTTNVTINNGDILALGGLLRTNEQDGTTQTPILSQIPLIGWMFKRKQKTQQSTNLTVFISPTVIKPRHRENALTYTKDYLEITRSWAKEGEMFDSLKDPITRWFFKGKPDVEIASKKLLAEDIRFQEDKPLAPKIKRGPQKSMMRYAENKKTPESAPQTVLADGGELPEEQLKDLFSSMDENPFASLQPEKLAQGKIKEPALMQEPARRKRRRR